MNLFELDEKGFSFLYGLANKNQLLDWFSVFLADYLFYILILVFLWVVFKERTWRRRFYLAALAGIAIILSRGIATPVIRFLYDRPRPFIADNIEPLINHIVTHSFPSGHLAIFTPIFLTLFLINRRLSLLFFVGAILIGIGRVATGVHWPTDIIGGILVGAVSFLVTYYLLKRKNVSLNA